MNQVNPELLYASPIEKDFYIDPEEISNLGKLLAKAHIPYRLWFDSTINQWFLQNNLFSVICGVWSYGGKDGLLELKFSGSDNVAGHLTSKNCYNLIVNHFKSKG